MNDNKFSPFLVRRLVCRHVVEQVKEITSHAESQSRVPLSQCLGSILGLENKWQVRLFRKLRQPF